MLIKQCAGYELEKEKANTSEDFFNQSEVVFVEEGKEKTLRILYVRYFEDKLAEISPYEKEPLFKAGNRDIFIRDLVALAALLKNPGYRHRKRVYMNIEKELVDLFVGLDFKKIPEIFEGLEKNGAFDIGSPLNFIIKPL